MQYIGLYSEKIKQCQLHDDTLPVLTFFKSNGYNQFVLSASEVGFLENSIAHFLINDFFDDLAGLTNHYASSKTDIGIGLLKTHQLKPENACLIGDTTHDFEVAQQMGCKCILVANGHQSASKLKETGAMVVEKLMDVPKLFAGTTSF
jgi:phosphoglycolate phosphatase